MKLSKKIISLASLATVASVVTPLSLTSCSSIQLEDITDLKHPTFEQYPGDITSDNADEVYTNFVLSQSRQEDVIEDFKWGMWQNWMSYFDWSQHSNLNWDEKGDNINFEGHLKSLKVGIKDLEFGTTKIAPPSTEHPATYPTVSFKMRIVVEGQTKVNNSSADFAENHTEHNVKLTCDVEYKDMLFFAYLSSRNDKTQGNGSESLAKYYQQAWFITTCSDNNMLNIHSYNQKEYHIKYNATWSDHVYRYIDGKETEQFNNGTFKGDIDSPEEMARINEYKDYSWSMQYDDELGKEIMKPGTGWDAWFNQEPQAIVANAILLDYVSWYIPDATSEEGNPDEMRAEASTMAKNIFTPISQKSIDRPYWGEDAAAQDANYLDSSMSIQLPAESKFVKALQANPNVDIHFAQGYLTTKGGKQAFNQIPYDRSSHVNCFFDEVTSKGTVESERHFIDKTMPVPEKTLPVQFSFYTDLPCRLSSNQPLGRPGQPQKIFLDLPFVVANLNGYGFDGDKCITTSGINDGLQFTIPTSINTPDGVNPFAMRFFLDGGDECILDFSNPKYSGDHQVVLPVQLENINQK